MEVPHARTHLHTPAHTMHTLMLSMSAWNIELVLRFHKKPGVGETAYTYATFCRGWDGVVLPLVPTLGCNLSPRSGTLLRDSQAGRDLTKS